MPSAEENQQWVRDRVEEAGLTKEIEAEAREVAQGREEMKGL
jgi:hypothetical protein